MRVFCLQGCIAFANFALLVSAEHKHDGGLMRAQIAVEFSLFLADIMMFATARPECYHLPTETESGAAQYLEITQLVYFLQIKLDKFQDLLLPECQSERKQGGKGRKARRK